MEGIGNEVKATVWNVICNHQLPAGPQEAVLIFLSPPSLPLPSWVNIALINLTMYTDVHIYLHRNIITTHWIQVEDLDMFKQRELLGKNDWTIAFTLGKYREIK